MSNMLFFFECDSTKVGDVFTALSPHMSTITNLRVETQQVIEKKTRKRKAQPTDPRVTEDRIKQYVSSDRSRVQKLIRDIVSDDPQLTSAEIGERLIPHGFKAGSASPALSYLRRAGILEQTNGRWDFCQRLL